MDHEKIIARTLSFHDRAVEPPSYPPGGRKIKQILVAAKYLVAAAGSDQRMSTCPGMPGLRGI